MSDFEKNLENFREIANAYQDILDRHDRELESYQQFFEHVGETVVRYIEDVLEIYSFNTSKLRFKDDCFELELHERGDRPRTIEIEYKWFVDWDESYADYIRSLNIAAVQMISPINQTSAKEIVTSALGLHI